MRGVLVDSDVLLDILTEHPTWYEMSAASLAGLAEIHTLHVNPIIYGEVAAAFGRIEDLDAAIPRQSFRRLDLPDAAVFLASRFREVPPGTDRTGLLVGAHASIADLILFTRSPRRYAAFPSVTLSTPRPLGPAGLLPLRAAISDNGPIPTSKTAGFAASR